MMNHISNGVKKRNNNVNLHLHGLFKYKLQRKNLQTRLLVGIIETKTTHSNRKTGQF